MAARRLLIVMLILLGLSTLAAALVPPQSLRKDETGTTATTETTESVPTDNAPTGEALEVVISVGGKTIPVVPISVGDQLDLSVCSKVGDQVEIPAFGLVDTIAPPAPAHFDLLAETPGSYGIEFVSTERIVARIEVSKPAQGGEKGTRSRAPEGSCPA